MSARLFRLMERHHRLDRGLRQLQLQRWPSPFQIARLKKLKLALKDRLSGLSIRKTPSRT